MNNIRIFLLNALLMLLVPVGNLGSMKSEWWTSFVTKDKRSRSYVSGFNQLGSCEIDELKITNCGVPVSRFGVKSIIAVFNASCHLQNKTFTFHFGKTDHYSLSITQKRPEIKIKAMRRKLKRNNKVFVAGTHYIFVQLEAKNPHNERVFKKTPRCNFFVVYENATAILGDAYRYVMNDTEFIVDGRKSINNDFEKEDIELRYNWTCADNAGFCMGRDLGHDSTVIVGKEYAIAGKNFQFDLRVRTVNSQWQSATQIISVDSTRPFAINCVENCGLGLMLWNPSRPPALFATCQYSCESFHLDTISAIVKTPEGNRTIEKIAIHPSFLSDIKPATQYEVLVVGYVQDVEEILDKQIFMTLPKTLFKNCELDPPEGNPLTKFSVNCQYDPNDFLYFEIEILYKNGSIFMVRSDYLEFIEFIAPVDSEVIVTILSVDGVKDSQRLKVNVKPLKESTKSAGDYALDLYEGNIPQMDSIQTSMLIGEFAVAIQTMDFLARELLKLKSKTKEDQENISKLKRFLIDTLNEIPINDFYISLSLSGVLKVLFQHKDHKIQRNSGVSLMDICRKISESQVYMMEDESNSEYEPADVSKIANNLLACEDTTLRNEFESSKNATLAIKISTRIPLNINLSENNIENYPDYIFDDVDDVDVQNVIEESEQGIGICRDMGNSLKFTVSNYENEPTYFEVLDKVFGVVKFTGKMTESIKFDQEGVSFVISSLLEKVDAIISVVFCIYKNDPFWSTSEKTTIPTKILDISLKNMDDYEEIEQFGDSPTIITFDVIRNVEEYEEHTASLNAVDWNLEMDDNVLTVFRIEVKAEEPFSIGFPNLEFGGSLRAVVTKMERPTLDHFSTAYDVNSFDNRIIINNKEYEDTWYFLAMIAGKMLGKSEVEFIVYTARCLSWDYDQNLWKFACPVDPRSSNKNIICRCSHFSTLAGSVIHNKVDEVPKFIALNFALVERGELSCLIVVSIIILIYFLLLILYVGKSGSKEDAVYFLADVPSTYLYGYLIETTTGRKLYSGTSSLITIQLFGTQGKSKEHVLNFPDPSLKLLQRKRKNLFVLGTHEYLGQLVKIHIWTDCNGLYPNWYCEEIKVCDLQIRKWWVFKMENWLRLDGNSPCMFLSVAAKLNTSESATVVNKRTRVLKRIFNFSNIENTIWTLSTKSVNPRFGYLKRLSVLLSLVLTLMSITMVMYGSPEFSARDTITSDCFFVFNWKIVYIGLFSSIIAFFPHMGLVLAFKRSDTFETKKLKTINSFPPIFSLIFGGLLIANIIFQTHILLIWGYWIVYPVSWQWFASSSISLIFCLFLLEQLWNIFLSLISRAEERSQLNYRRILINVEKQRHYLYSHFGNRIYRPIMTNLYVTLSRFDYMRRRINFLQNLRTIWQFQDLVLVLFFIIFLYVIVLDDKNTANDFWGHKEANDLINGVSSSKFTLFEVKEFDDLANYIEKTLIRNVQSYEWYGRYVSESPGMTVDKSNRYLGIIRLQQHRVKDNSCDTQEIMKFLNRTCKSSNYLFLEDTSSYLPAWKKKTDNLPKSRQDTVWFYAEGLGEVYFGSVGFYGKGGYFADLGRNIRNSLITFNYLRRNNWMDIFTRAVIAEVTLYNVNTNLFHFIVIVIERTSSGYLNNRVFVHTTRIMAGNARNEILYVLCILFFIGLIISLVIRIVSRFIRTNGWKQIDFCHIFNIALACLGLSWIIMYFSKMFLMKQFAKEIEEKRNNEFLDYFDILRNVFAMKVVASLLIFLCSIRLLIMLRFARIFQVVKRTLFLSFTTFTYMLLYYLIIYTAFAGISFVLFDEKNEAFKNGYINLKSLIFLSARHKDSNNSLLVQIVNGFDYLFVVSFYLISFFFAMVSSAILITNYMKAKEFSSEERMNYNYKDCAMQKVEYLKRLAMILKRKFRLTAGAKKSEKDGILSPKRDEIRYKNSVRVDSNRMTAMSSVAKCVLMKRKKSSTLEEETMLRCSEPSMTYRIKERGKTNTFLLSIRKTEDVYLLMIEEW
ncbi:hypothetical protein WA026_022554 [Henosepilachna vigintioctopunctata]|uniref:PLAT domain-containing protein n=1 Tax=Henosepilachna vigintioctopunctata TaxID=420089 RepID=A0AAW1VFS0_9CUCU